MSENDKPQPLVHKSSSMKKVFELVKQVAQSEATCLITGESGTGKELVAGLLHHQSPRAQAPFVPVNCGALPGELLESELFGHTKGAFTGAHKDRIGRFEAAREGTIFFDEIGDMSAHLQVKLLRVLQCGQFEPLGSNQSLHSKARIVAATHINLEEAVQEGRFRKDLFYRLNVIPIHIPPLRQRREDILMLFHYFLTQSQNIHQLKGIRPDAMQILLDYSWPGNVRELENCIEHMITLKRTGFIEIQDLPPQYKSHSPMASHLDTSQLSPMAFDSIDFNSATEAYENQLILQALRQTEWNRSQAATLLKLNRTTLTEKIKKRGLCQDTPIEEAPLSHNNKFEEL